VAESGNGAMADAVVAELERPTLIFATVIDPTPPTPNWNDNVHEYVPAGKVIARLFLVPLTTFDVV
jgi:hypothetical protein